MKTLKAILMIVIPGLIIGWLLYDFYYTMVDGVTYKIRMNGILDIREHPFIFFLTVTIKLGFFVFMLSLIRDGYKLFRKTLEK